MYKYFLFFIFFLLLFNFNVSSKGFVDIDNNSLVILKDDDNISLLIKESDNYNLIVISGFTSKYKYFTRNIDNIIYINKANNYVVDGFEIKNDDFFSINLLDKYFCLYKDKKNYNKDYNDCDYIYIIYNNVYFDIDDRVNAIFYNEYSKFSNKFLEELFSSWVDTYTINNKEFIVIDFNYDYEIRVFN